MTRAGEPKLGEAPLGPCEGFEFNRTASVGLIQRNHLLRVFAMTQKLSVSSGDK